MQLKKKTSSKNATMSFEGGGKYPGWRKARRKARQADRQRKRLAKKLSKSCSGGSCFG